MEGKTQLLPVKLDLVFKLIFGDQRNTDILASFLKSVLDIPEEEYGRVTVIDPHVKAEHLDDKYGILDVKIHTKSGNVVHIEIQVDPVREMGERVVYYQSKLVTEQIAGGQDYAVIRKAVSIIIADYALLPGSGRYHHQFRYRTRDGVEFTDLVEINTLELSKLPREADRTELWNWMRFIGSNDEEELKMLATKSPELKKAVGVLKELSADERMRMLAESREKARRDEASRVNWARDEGRAEGEKRGRIEVARKLLKLERPIDEIAEATGLARNEIESL